MIKFNVLLVIYEYIILCFLGFIAIIIKNNIYFYINILFMIFSLEISYFFFIKNQFFMSFIYKNNQKTHKTTEKYIFTKINNVKLTNIIVYYIFS